MKILVVANNNGEGRVRPFPSHMKYPGELFWICGEPFRISKENRIKIGKKFMNRYGYTRRDGRKALIIEAGAWWYRPSEVDEEQAEELGMIRKEGMYLMLGAHIKRGPEYIPYYELESGTKIPVDLD